MIIFLAWVDFWAGESIPRAFSGRRLVCYLYAGMKFWKLHEFELSGVWRSSLYRAGLRQSLDLGCQSAVCLGHSVLSRAEGGKGLLLESTPVGWKRPNWWNFLLEAYTPEHMMDFCRDHRDEWSQLDGNNNVLMV